MSLTAAEFDRLLAEPEGEHLEFKEAGNHYDFEKLVRYCAALANEGGGYMILGVTDQRPRHVVGTSAFAEPARTAAGLIDRLQLRIEVEELLHPDGRVLVFRIPSRPLGVPIQYRGAYWMRSGEDLVPMTPDMLRHIFAEAGPDFSGQVCPGASLADLDSTAIQRFRAMWARKSGNQSLLQLSAEQLLSDAELLTEDGVTYAALVLLGTRVSLGRYLAQAEVVFEYRSGEAAGPAQQRREFREGFLLYQDDLWGLINLRNDVQHVQIGLFMQDIPTFGEVVVREALLNAVCHRDYRLPGSVFVRQYPGRLEIDSPGGFPPGITPENIFWRQVPRNRRLAESFARCGLVERAGQGVNRMFEECIREAKAKPDYSRSDDYQVSLVLQGEIRDPRFLRFMEEVAKEAQSAFTTEDLLVLDLVHREEPVPDSLTSHLHSLLERGIVERVSYGRGTRYLLSRRFYQFIGEKGTYTRRRGLDRETNKALLLKHIRDNHRDGSALGELCQVLPASSRAQVQSFLRELKAEGLVHPVGRTKAARWYPGPIGDGIAS